MTYGESKETGRRTPMVSPLCGAHYPGSAIDRWTPRQHQNPESQRETPRLASRPANPAPTANHKHRATALILHLQTMSGRQLTRCRIDLEWHKINYA